ncbi:uncharacterized protein LOC120236427 [Hyaena hyaena]|uniref:uncharacterized protein LOC120236427 n=1 Tax=Hyaena hyaena TaxID=95912 RepID=UPI001921F488|nr:uncharacterized protein LOC120236427 [Hyaena hyaena]
MLVVGQPGRKSPSSPTPALFTESCGLLAADYSSSVTFRESEVRVCGGQSRPRHEPLTTRPLPRLRLLPRREPPALQGLRSRPQAPPSAADRWGTRSVLGSAPAPPAASRPTARLSRRDFRCPALSKWRLRRASFQSRFPRSKFRRLHEDIPGKQQDNKPQEEDAGGHLGTMRGAMLRMMQTSRKAQQRKGNKQRYQVGEHVEVLGEWCSQRGHGAWRPFPHTLSYA